VRNGHSSFRVLLSPLLVRFPKASANRRNNSARIPVHDSEVRAYFDLGVNSVYLALKIMRDWIYRLSLWTSDESGKRLYAAVCTLLSRDITHRLTRPDTSSLSLSFSPSNLQFRKFASFRGGAKFSSDHRRERVVDVHQGVPLNDSDMLRHASGDSETAKKVPPGTLFRRLSFVVVKRR